MIKFFLVQEPNLFKKPQLYREKSRVFSSPLFFKANFMDPPVHLWYFVSYIDIIELFFYRGCPR